MNKTKFVKKLVRELEKNFPEYEFKREKNSIYNTIVNPENKSYSNSPKNPAREQMDFQPDIMVLKNELPLVLIETKYKDFSTQDILTYSEKVIKHKEIFSHLRYGFILGGNKKIDQRYFTHNRGFDFALAIPRVDDKEMKNLIGLLKKEIGILNN